MTKKTFMAAIIILAFLVSMLAGLQILKVAEANPFSPHQLPQDAYLTIYSPKNQVYNESSIPLQVTLHINEVSFNGEKYTERVIWLNYSLDEDSQPLPFRDSDAHTILSNLSDGAHSLTVYGETTFNVFISTNVSFTVHANPQMPTSTPTFSINMFSPKQNQTFNSTNINLNLNITETSICKILAVSYYLDGLQSEKVSVSGLWFWNDYQWLQHYFPIDFQFSQRVDNLSQGPHSITVNVEYNDTNDAYSLLTRMVNSRKIDFVVNLPTEIQSRSPSPTPTVSPIVIHSPSPTQQPTLTPVFIGSNVIAYPMVNYNPALIALSTIIVMVVWGVAVYIHFRKRE